MKNQFNDDKDILEALNSQVPAQVNAALKHLLQSAKLRGSVRQQVFALGGNEDDAREFLNQALVASRDTAIALFATMLTVPLLEQAYETPLSLVATGDGSPPLIVFGHNI